ncbi:hypothetical protein RJ640_016588 [Escallonia rubra]|uniref:Uncharacterized protein n=1 Tax=Escallonia rubra TaxID=112253 RepID=A0AA88RVD6_9ASTE|nr:hypothetical protein RJ640_016588 [Escallonia rubra]
MAHGHMIPTLDMAKLFTSHGVKTTIITTPLNASVFAKTIERTKRLGADIGLRVIKFPTVEAGLPEGCECADQITSNHLLPIFVNATTMLQEQLEQVIPECRPNCLVADMLFPWATGVAAKFDIPRLESELTRYGVIVNSFYELEPDYAVHYTKILERKAWYIGPLMAILTTTQLYEMAMGLEASGQQFIWAVRRCKDEEKWLPEGFEQRVKGRGLVIRGWAPQVLILDHEAVGGFVTHCGWNSTLEGCSRSRSIKKRTQVLRTGVAVGSKEFNRFASDGVKREEIEEAVKRIMVGEEAEERRSRAKELKETARKAAEKGGSSYTQLNALFEVSERLLLTI